MGTTPTYYLLIQVFKISINLNLFSSNAVLMLSNFYVFDLPMFWSRACLKKVIPETRVLLQLVADIILLQLTP